jgi:hypothetical protein
MIVFSAPQGSIVARVRELIMDLEICTVEYIKKLGADAA